MENRLSGPEEQDDTTDSASSKKKRGSTLSRYLSALRGKEAPKDSSEDAAAEKPKRAQRLLSRLFPRMVERPAHLSSEGTSNQEHDFNHEAWFGWARQAKQAELTRPSSEQSEYTPASEVANTDTASTQIETPESERPQETSRSDYDQVAAEISETPLATSDTFMPTSNRPEQVQRSESHEPSNHSRAEFVALPRQQGEIPLQTVREAETIIERRGSNVLPIALVGAEYLGRKRADRKLESRIDKKIDASNEKQQHSVALQKELEQVVSQNKQQIEQLKKARTAMERQVPRASERKEAAPVAAEVRRVTQPEAVRIEQKQPSTEEAIKPQNIAERVADAAEHDVPVERAFERSHEVKDDISVATAAASVGAVMAANIAAAGLAPIKQDKGSLAPVDTSSLPFVSDADIAASYKQAAKMGFWTAICLIVLGVIAYLMVRYI